LPSSFKLENQTLKTGEQTMVEISKEIEQLKEKINLHQVCYEVCPEILMVSGQQTQVGFELLLFGTHEHGKSQLTPGWVEPHKRHKCPTEMIMSC
jgi:hypothetical protein